MQKKRLSPGTIFWEKYNGYYYFFKVILDFKDVTKRGYTSSGMAKAFHNNYNDFFETSPNFYLVQVFSGRYSSPNLPENTTILINGIKITSNFQKKRYYEGEEWAIYGEDKINVKSIDCYEMNAEREPYGGKNWFFKGNIGLIYSISLNKSSYGTLFFETTKLCELVDHLMGFRDRKSVV